MNYTLKDNTYFAKPKDDWKDRIELSKSVGIPAFLSVKAFVFPFCHYFKIFWSVVIFNFVNMMYPFVSFKKATNFFFGDQNRSINISPLFRTRVIRFPDIKVSRFRFVPPFIIWTGLSLLKLSLWRKVLTSLNFFSPMCSDHGFVETKTRTIFFPILNPTRGNKKWFLTGFAYNFSHNLLYQNR